uniref:Uncharacterized protein n=1 Tax=Gadus morhua TaxID=8049 RepID=A0A8C5FRW8_GADMO
THLVPERGCSTPIGGLNLTEVLDRTGLSWIQPLFISLYLLSSLCRLVLVFVIELSMCCISSWLPVDYITREIMIKAIIDDDIIPW